MKSPFAIFRKNQKIMMVVLTGLAMLSFVVLDTIGSQGSGGGSMVLMLIAALVGGGIFWLLGRDTGKGSTYAAVGALIGVLVGVWLQSTFKPPAPISTAMGDLTQQDIAQRIERRNTANIFLRVAYEKVSPPPENPFMMQFWMQGLQQSQFGFGSDDPEADVVTTFLLEQEADEMGIQLSDDAVTKYIQQATTIRGKGLTSADFQEIRTSMPSRPSETELYDAIRGELRARLAFILSMPREVSTPEQYWQDYRKLNVRQHLELAAVPIGEFTSEVADPSEGELEAYFEQGKNLFLDNPARKSTTQAFGQPRRVRVAYLEADYEAVEATIAPITDEEIEKYYNDNKEQFRNRPLPNLEGGGDPFLQQDGPAFPGGNESSPLTPGLTPEAGTEEKGESSIKKPAGDTEGEKEPAKDESSEKAPADDSGQARVSVSSEGLLAQGPIASPAIASDLLLSALGEAEEAEKKEPAGEPANEAKQEEKGTESQTPADDASSASKEKSPVTPPKRRPVVASRPMPEFKPLDQSLRDTIRDQLLRERTITAQRASIDAARDHMFKLGEQFTAKSMELNPELELARKQEESLRIARELNDAFSTDLKKYAEEHKLRYVETTPVSGAELYESIDYALGKAVEPMMDEFSMRQPTPVVQTLFSSQPDQLFQPYTATDRTDKWFVYWKVDDIAAHVPKLDDPGIREQVLAVWKSNQARPKADERAKAVAELVRNSGDKGMSEALADQTVTGKEGGNSLVVIPTPLVSWLRVSTAPSTGLMPNRQPELSDIPGVDNPDAKFMQTVFEEMNVGDVSVVPNADQSIYYVVKVKSRLPSEASDIEASRQAFLREDLFGGGSLFGGASTYDYLMMPEQQQVRRDWIDLLHKKYNVRRNQLPEEPSSARPLGS